MRLTVVLSAAAMAVSTIANAAEPVDIVDGSTSLRGVLYRPEGAGPFPSVVALHGCSGLINSSGKVVARFADWGDRLAAAGLAVLFPDSFASRDLGNQCRVRERRCVRRASAWLTPMRRSVGCKRRAGRSKIGSR